MKTFAYIVGALISGAHPQTNPAQIVDHNRQYKNVFDYEKLIGSLKASNVATFDGPINEAAIDQIERKVQQYQSVSGRKIWLLITSPGGEADAFIRLSSLVENEFAGVIVSGNCYSACAELLMTVNLPVLVGPRATIKFHINPLMSRKLLEQHQMEVKRCIERRANWYSANFRANISVEDFSARVQHRLNFVGAPSMIDTKNPECPNYVFKSRNDFYTADILALQRLTDRRIVKWVKP